MAATTYGPATEPSAVPPPPERRITVALIPKAAAELQHLQDRTSMSKTDIVNRAISLYEFIDEEIRAGHDLLIRDAATGEAERIRLL
jgi:predicted transcriptional regulator